MKSGWFFGTPMWEEYQTAYHAGRERPQEYKSSPLADDHDFTEAYASPDRTFTEHQTQVIDLTKTKEELWRDVRASYHSIIHRADEKYIIAERKSIEPFMAVHKAAFGLVRSKDTFLIQAKWLADGHALSMVACESDELGEASPVAATLWIVHQGKAYYASGPAVERNVQHAVIWHSLMLLKERGVTLVDMGQIDGETEKERNIGKFKAGFGGEARSFTIVRKS